MHQVIKFNTLSSAIALAEFAHRTQVDKAGLPYIEHPRRVLAKVQAQGALPYVQQAAILHDVPEDTSISHDMLLGMGFSEAVVQITRLLDREYSRQTMLSNYETSYKVLSKESTAQFYYEEIAKNPGAKMVKLADIEDNLSPWRLAHLTPETQVRLVKKYNYAKEILA